MGLIGMAFGLGFIFGPAISGIALKLFGATGPGWTAAALCAANFLLAFSILAESLEAGFRPRHPPPAPEAMGSHAGPAENRPADPDFFPGHVCLQLF